MPAVDPLARGAERLAAGDWQAAHDLFTATLRGEETAEALSGLGEALFWMGDFARGLALRERAYLAYRERGDRAAAARLALWLAAEHPAALGNDAVGAGWLGRAERLITELGSCAERGWLLLRRSRRAPDPAAAVRLARQALALGQRHADRALEIAAISQQGRALLGAGRTDEGFACLDEAMAAATSGEVRSPDTVTGTCCDMIGACERTMELERATQWCQVTDEYARRYKFAPLYAFCRVTYAGVLIAVGRWADADRELAQALAVYHVSLASRAVLALAKLAELRLLQGRDAEAEELLREHTGDPAAAKAAAMLHLARGEAAAAARLLGRRLRVVGADQLAAAPLEALLVEAQLAARHVAAAAAAAARLRRIAARTRCAAFAAAAALAAAQVKSARHDRSAVDDFETAIDLHRDAGMPLGGARARLGLARLLAEGDRRAAAEHCRTAVATLEALGARRELDAAADLCRRLGVGARVGPRVTTQLTRREEEVLALVALGLSNAKIGARLFISPKTVEHHVGNLLAKLGLGTRAAAAAWAARRGAQKPAAK